MSPGEDAQRAALDLGELLTDAGRVVALTGAGASAASGVPTYRGAGGSWTRYDPGKYASIDYFRKDPSYYWSFFRDERYPALASAEPNAVHFALATLERAGLLKALITQNIDGLHQAGGSKRVLELHGNSRRFLCEGCGAAPAARQGPAPKGGSAGMTRRAPCPGPTRLRPAATASDERPTQQKAQGSALATE